MNDLKGMYLIQAPARINRSRQDDIMDKLRELSKEELIQIIKNIIELINSK